MAPSAGQKPPPVQNAPQVPVIDRLPVLPNIESYAGKLNAINKTYYIYFDQALRDSQQNSLAMRRDGFVHEILRHRQLPVVCLPWHVEVEDPDHPFQKSISETVGRIIGAIPRLRTMFLILLEAIFYGRYGAQVIYGTKKVAGNRWNLPVGHIPVNGDKFRYKHDMTPGIALRSGVQFDKSRDATAFLNAFAPYVQNSMLGQALFLETEFLRDRFVIHQFEPFDTDYLFELEEAQSMFGLGLRSRLYWTWNLRTELLSWVMDALQRVGANGMLYGFYPEGNYSAQREVLNALQMLVKDNISAFPVKTGDNSYKDIIQRIEASPIGYEVMISLIDRLEGIMRRACLGQDLSSESKPTGIGGGAAKLQGDVRNDYIEYDATSLGETITQDLLNPILKYNKFIYEGGIYYGNDLPFTMNFKFQVTRENVGEAIQAAGGLYQMGVDLDADDLRRKAGLSPPKKKSSAVVNYEIKNAQQEFANGVPDYKKSGEHLKELVNHVGSKVGQKNEAGPDGEKRRALGKPQRFAHAGDPDDCGHEPSGLFDRENTCAGGGTVTMAPEENFYNLHFADLVKNKKYKNACKDLFGRVISPRKLLSMVAIDRMNDIAGEKVVPKFKIEMTGQNHAMIAISAKTKNLEFFRVIAKDTKGRLIMKNSIFFSENTGHGLGLNVFADQVEACIGMGVSRIECHAEKSSTMNGYYTWPRFGYDGIIPENVSHYHKKKFFEPMGISPDEYGNYYVSQFMKSPEGREYWKNNGNSIEVDFDLSEGSLSRHILSSYLKEKGKSDPAGPNRFRRQTWTSKNMKNRDGENIRRNWTSGKRRSSTRSGTGSASGSGIVRMTRAGDPDDCGHERKGGEFSLRNKCAGGGGGPDLPRASRRKGFAFQSPNVKEETDFKYASKMLHSSAHAAALRKSMEIDSRYNLRGKTYSAIGDWADGAEDSVVTKYDNVDSFDDLRKAAALKGLAWRQKAVIGFMADKNGPDSVYEINLASRDLKAIRRSLDEAGIQFRSLIPGRHGTRVILFDQGSSLADNVLKFMESNEHVSGKSYRGHGEFIGSWDSRTEASRAYRKILGRQAEGVVAGRYRGRGRVHHGGVRKPPRAIREAAARFGFKVVAAGLPGQKASHVSNGKIYYDPPKAAKIRGAKKGTYSSASFWHPVLHEIGKLATGVIEKDNAIVDWKIYIPIAKQVSKLATKGPNEFLAEVFAAIAAKRSLPIDVIALADELSGWHFPS